MELGLESIDVVAPSVPRDVGLNEGLDPGFIGTWKGDCGLQSADFAASDGLPEVFEEGYGLILGEGFVGNGVRADAYEVSSPDSDVSASAIWSRVILFSRISRFRFAFSLPDAAPRLYHI